MPPESKDKLSDIIRALLQLVLAGILLSIGLPALFILLHVLTWPTNSKKYSEVEQTIGLVNRVQYSKIREDETFAKTFDELAIGTVQGSNIANSSTFQYKLDIQSKDLAIISAKPIDKEKNGFNGAVLRYKNRKGFFAARSIMCKSAVAGADGTERMNLPVVNALGKLSCAPNWTILEENNKEQSEQELIEFIQNEAKDEIGRILREQDSIYYKQGKFVGRYSDIPQEKNRSSPKFNVKIRSRGERAIVTIQHDPSEKAKYKTSFGFIKLVKFKQAQPLSVSD